jgi:hypothetical protein
MVLPGALNSCFIYPDEADAALQHILDGWTFHAADPSAHRLTAKPLNHTSRHAGSADRGASDTNGPTRALEPRADRRGVAARGPLIRDVTFTRNRRLGELDG